MPNRTFLDPRGFIHQILTGDQTAESLAKATKESQILVAQLQKQSGNRPVNFLIDLSQVGRQDMAMRQASAKSLQTMPFGKIALFGLDGFLKHVANLVIIASGKQSRVKQFRDEASATAWLLK